MEENKRAAELLDEKQERAADAAAEKKQAISDPGEQLRKLCSGTMTLMHPFKAHDQEVQEIKFDFCSMTGSEMMDALDSAPANNMFTITNAQAMAMFAATAAKCAPFIEDGNIKSRLYDARDVKARLGAADAVKAIQLAKLFYHAAGQVGGKNTSNA